MAAHIHRLRTRPQKRREDTAQELIQLVLELGLPQPIETDMLRAIERHVPSSPGDWTFLMISPHQNKAVVRWLDANSARPRKAVLLWSELFPVLDRRTGEILATREQLAELVGCRLTHVSAIMTELERIGAIIRKRDGRTVRYFMNPNVATNLAGPARARAQAAAPTLRLVTS